MSNFENQVSDFFDEADTGGDGCLERLELAKILLKCGCKRSTAEIVEWFDELDRNDDDKISKAEFMSALTKIPACDVDEMKLRQAFNAIDVDGSGFITREELQQALDDEGISSEAHLDMDGNEDGKISCDEFLDRFRASYKK